MIGIPMILDPAGPIKGHMDRTNAVSAASHHMKKENGLPGFAIHTLSRHGAGLKMNMRDIDHAPWIKSSSKMYSIEMETIFGSTSANYAKQPQDQKDKLMIRFGCVHMIWRKERLCVRIFNVIVSAIIVSSNIVMKNVSISRVMSEFTCVGPALSYRHCSIPG